MLFSPGDVGGGMRVVSWLNGMLFLVLTFPFLLFGSRQVGKNVCCLCSGRGGVVS